MNKSGIRPISQQNHPLDIGGFEFSVLTSEDGTPGYEVFHITGLETTRSPVVH